MDKNYIAIFINKSILSFYYNCTLKFIQNKHVMLFFSRISQRARYRMSRRNKTLIDECNDSIMLMMSNINIRKVFKQIFKRIKLCVFFIQTMRHIQLITIWKLLEATNKPTAVEQVSREPLKKRNTPTVTSPFCPFLFLSLAQENNNWWTSQMIQVLRCFYFCYFQPNKTFNCLPHFLVHGENL